MKKIHNNKGFTLVELLATIALLAVITTIVIYSATSVVKNTKENSYKVTINNIQNNANSYVLEELGSSMWLDVSGVSGKLQYQCVTVQNLIDAGYFKSDVLESFVAENRPVLATDNIYLERDVDTKTITMNVLLYDEYRGLCNDFSVAGNITFIVNPTGWTTEKNVTIKYNLYNIDSQEISENKYHYDYVVDDLEVDGYFDKYVVQKEFNTKNTDQLNASIQYKDGTVLDKSLLIEEIDNIKPYGEIKSTNYVASKQDVTLTMSDSGSGISAYYFGTDNPNEKTVSWISLSGVKSKTLNTNVSVEGTYYLGIKDRVGNLTVVSTMFCKTTLNISNGSVSPKVIITKSGNNFEIPEPKMNTYYSFGGWYTDSTYSGSVIYKYTPVGKVNNLYGKVTENKLTGGAVRVDGKVIYGETLNAVITSDTTPKADKYEYQWYTNTTNSTSGGTKITGATSNSLKLNGDLVGKYIYVVVTATKENYRSISFKNKTDTPVSKRPITVIANSKTKTYDGSILSDSGCTLSTTEGMGLVSGHKLDGCVMSSSSELVYVGSVSNVILRVTIKENNKSVSNYYNITKINGTLTILEMPKSYSIVYRANGGTGSMSYNICVENRACSIKNNEFTRKGYSFVGWTTNSDGMDDGYNWTGWSGTWTFANGDKGIQDGKLYLYARWEPYVVKIKYSVNGGSITRSAGGYTWTRDRSGIIRRNYADYSLNINYGEKIVSSGLADWDNPDFMNITRSDRWVKSGYEWICLQGDCVGKIYDDHDGTYTSDDFCDASNGDCEVVVGVNWKEHHNVTIKYAVNGGTISASAGGYTWTTDSNGVISQNGSLYKYTVRNDYSLSDAGYPYGLADWNNTTNVNISKTNNTAKSGAEWKCIQGDCKGKTYNQSSDYEASDFCDASDGDCEVVIGPNWTPIYRVYVQYAVNGGTIASSAGGYTWSTNSSGLVMRNGSIYSNSFVYGKNTSSDGLSNWDNSSNINISKIGHGAVEGAEWKCQSGCKTSGATFSDSKVYNANDFCDASNGNCTVVLKVNWTPKTYTITYVANGGYSKVATDGNKDSYCSTSYKVGGNHDVSGTMAQQTCTYGETCILNANAFSRQCNTFKGWTTYSDTDSTDYTGRTFEATSANNYFFKNKDGFKYDKAGNITLYAVWKSSHNFKGMGNQLYSTAGLYQCGYTHNDSGAYAVYCSKCQMSAHHYNYCYKPGYEEEEAGKWCPCNYGATAIYNDKSKFGFTSTKQTTQTKLYSYGGTIEGNAKFATATATKICTEH